MGDSTTPSHSKPACSSASRTSRTVRSMLSLKEKAPAAKAFKTENKDLAAIHEMCRRTFQANMIGGVQSDCPGRERLGYGGDIVSTYEAYMLNWDMRAIYLKVLQDFADEAADDGWLTETAPYVGIGDKGFGKRAGPISWALAVPELIDGLLRHYNETKALYYYPVCTRYVRQVAAKFPDGLIPKCIGDHEVERRPDLRRLDMAYVRALEHGDARVLPQLPGQVAVADVDGGNRSGSRLEKAVGKPTRRAADISTM